MGSRRPRKIPLATDGPSLWTTIVKAVVAPALTGLSPVVVFVSEMFASLTITGRILGRVVVGDRVRVRAVDGGEVDQRVRPGVFAPT